MRTRTPQVIQAGVLGVLVCSSQPICIPQVIQAGVLGCIVFIPILSTGYAGEDSPWTHKEFSLAEVLQYLKLALFQWYF